MPQARGTRVRCTRQAAAVIAVMSGLPAFSGAREIHDAVRRHGEGIGLATVYRHLRVLAEHGSVDVIRGACGEARYRLRRGGITHQLTCRVCGRAVEVDGQQVWEWARQIAAEQGFMLTTHMVELAGLCPWHAAGVALFPSRRNASLARGRAPWNYAVRPLIALPVCLVAAAQ